MKSTATSNSNCLNYVAFWRKTKNPPPFIRFRNVGFMVVGLLLMQLTLSKIMANGQFEEGPWNSLLETPNSFNSSSLYSTVPIKNDPHCNNIHKSLIQLTPNSKKLSKGFYASGWRHVANTPIPHQCETYESKYSLYRADNSISNNIISSLKRCIPNPKGLVILKLHSKSPVSEDMVLHMRSLVVEAGWGSENHVMFLVHHKSNQTLSQTEKNTILLLSNIPTEFHSLCHVFTDGEMKAEYSGYSEQRFHPHITFAHVMRLHPKYELVWFIEEDVRYTGRWPTLFRDVELFANNQGLQQVPDFVSFEDICEPTSDWVYSKECEHVFDRQTQRHSLGVVWGWSQNLAKALIDRLKKDDQNCYYEVFPPSVAKNASLNSLFVPHSLFFKKGHREDWGRLPACQKPLVGQESVPGGWTFNDGVKSAKDFYADWMKGSRNCFPNALLHPIKEK